VSTPATTTTGSTSEPKKLIHFFKRQKSADVIREIQQYQTTPYNLVEVRSIIEWLKAKLEDVEKGGVDMYDLSCQLEPKEKEDERL
jgi:son of sevenless-like protein